MEQRSRVRRGDEKGNSKLWTVSRDVVRERAAVCMAGEETRCQHRKGLLLPEACEVFDKGGVCVPLLLVTRL